LTGQNGLQHPSKGRYLPGETRMGGESVAGSVVSGERESSFGEEEKREGESLRKGTGTIGRTKRKKLGETGDSSKIPQDARRKATSGEGRRERGTSR